MSAQDEKEVMKAAMKEALREWLDEKYATFGRFSLHGLAAAGLGAVAYFVLILNGWHK